MVWVLCDVGVVCRVCVRGGCATCVVCNVSNVSCVVTWAHWCVGTVAGRCVVVWYCLGGYGLCCFDFFGLLRVFLWVVL